MKLQTHKKWMQIGSIMLAMGVIATLHFNCAPGEFKAASHLDSSSNISSKDLFADVVSPYALMTHNQIFKTMSNLTNQPEVTGSQRNEFNIRAGSLPEVPNVGGVSAPLQMAATSLAGEFCNGAISAETAAGATPKLFMGINFNAPISSNTNAYMNMVSIMSDSFYGRPLKSEEQQIFKDFLSEFQSDSGSTGNAGTRKLVLATCAAMLASFDAITY